MVEEILKKLCLAIASGELKSDRFNRLRVESPLDLEGTQCEIANKLLNGTEQSEWKNCNLRRTFH